MGIRERSREFWYDLRGAAGFIKRGDGVVIAVVALTAVVIAVWGWISAAGAGKTTAVIYQSGEKIYEVTAEFAEVTERYIYDGGKVIMTVRLDSEGVSVVESDCAGGDCVRMGAVNRAGQVIACLPNRVMIVVESGRAAEYDVVAGG